MLNKEIGEDFTFVCPAQYIKVRIALYKDIHEYKTHILQTAYTPCLPVAFPVSVVSFKNTCGIAVFWNIFANTIS